jgi:hypothetical protein
MVHMLADSAQGRIDAVVKRFDPDESKQNLIAAVRMGAALHGDAPIQRWRTDTEPYPDGLVRAVVERRAQIDHFWRISMWRERRDLTGVHGKIVGVHGAIFATLLALNRIYSFGVKHRGTLIAMLKIAPQDLGRRLDDCFNQDLPASEETLRLLVEEMYDLIEREVAGVDVERLRRIFRYRRPLWDGIAPTGLSE